MPKAFSDENSCDGTQCGGLMLENEMRQCLEGPHPLVTQSF